MRDELETATNPAGETARQYGQRTQVTPLQACELRMITSGARTCAKCKHRPSYRATGDPQAWRPICRYCDENGKLDRRIETQRAQHSRMRRRG